MKATIDFFLSVLGVGLVVQLVFAFLSKIGIASTDTNWTITDLAVLMLLIERFFVKKK